MFAAHHRLGNLNLVVDDNRISMLGPTDQIVSHQDLGARLAAFGWQCESVDGHDVGAVRQHLMRMKAATGGVPKALVCRTHKGHGVPDLEDAPLCHVINPKPQLLDELLQRP